MDARIWNRRYWIPSDTFTTEEYARLLRDAGFDVFDLVRHAFTPRGFTAVFLLGESHLAIHTFPEAGRDYVELSSCNLDMLRAFDDLLREETCVKNVDLNHVPGLSFPEEGFIDTERNLVFEAQPGGTYCARTIDEILVHEKTPYQEFAILRSGGELSLWIDGVLQSREGAERIYHELLVHPGVLTAGRVESVLVLGGGEGAVLRELRKYQEITNIDMVDADEALVRACQDHLASYHEGAFSDPRVRLTFADATEFVRTCDRQYDLVVLDLPDIGSGASENLDALTSWLRSSAAYAQLASLLHDHGRVVSYFGDSFTATSARDAIREAAKAAFPFQWTYRANDVLLSFLLLSKQDLTELNVGPSADLNAIRANIDAEIAKRVSGGLRVYDGFTHISSVAAHEVQVTPWRSSFT